VGIRVISKRVAMRRLVHSRNYVAFHYDAFLASLRVQVISRTRNAIRRAERR